MRGRGFSIMIFCLMVTLHSARGESLKEAVKGRFLMGVAVGAKALDDPKIAGMVGREFDCVTPEVEFKPRVTEAAEGKFDFSGGDKILAFAQGHGMKVVGHNLCWHIHCPAWMFTGADGKPLPREVGLAHLKEHIDAVAGNYKGKVIGWDVVNEAISDKKGEYLRDTPARASIGDDYILQAYQFAHAADPGAALYYNEYGNENGEKLAKTLRLIGELKAKGVPLEAVGIQSHFGIGRKGLPEELEKAIQAYEKAGVKVMLSELDVDMLPRSGEGADLENGEKGPKGDLYPKGLPEAAAKREGEFYAGIFRVVLKHPGEVTRVTFWGTDDAHTWLNDWPIVGRRNYPLLFDREAERKEPYDAVMRVLNEK